MVFGEQHSVQGINPGYASLYFEIFIGCLLELGYQYHEDRVDSLWFIVVKLNTHTRNRYKKICN